MRNLLTGEDDPHDYVADHKDFIFAVGQIIIATSRLDGTLFELARYILKGFDDKQISLLFHRSPSIADHLRFVDTLMGDFLDEEVSARCEREWTSIKKEAEEVITFRNHVAHNPATFRSRWTHMEPSEDGMRYRAADEPGFFFISTSWDRIVRKANPPPKDIMPVRVNDLRAMTDRTVALQDRVLHLVKVLVGTEPPP